MIDISLVDTAVNIDNYQTFDQNRPCLFLGFAIKNEYDNQRLKISEKYNPSRQLFAFTKKPGEYRVLPLYGLFMELNSKGKELVKTIIDQEKNIMGIKIYEDILEQYNMSCRDSYSYLNKNIYPIDFEHFTSITDDELINDGKILQHLLELDDNKFDFQKFGAFKLLILV